MFNAITVIGCGLIGSSLLRAIDKNNLANQIKTFDNKAFVIDMENQLRCFDLDTGELLWSVKTQKSLLRSQKKQSLILKNEKVYFSNSIGDVTAVNISDGRIIWQTPIALMIIHHNVDKYRN